LVRAGVKFNMSGDALPEDSQWAIITVTYNSADALRQYWSSVELGANVRWIVVDNASQDDSADVAEDLGATVVRLSQNRGFGAANNIGMRASGSSRYVGFVNPDVAIDPASLSALESVIGSSSLVAPQLVNPDGSPQPNGRGYPSLPAKIANRLLPGRFQARYRLFAGLGEVRPVAWITGAAVLGHRETLDSLGPWDEWFFVYHEDADLGMRALLAGMEVLVDGSTRWVHGWARETKSFKWGPWKLEIASASKFYRRYPEMLLSPSFSRLFSRTRRWPRISDGEVRVINRTSTTAPLTGPEWLATREASERS
jgi:GT2 family glycosyltransferase